ncbi:MAG: group III truncated hemoglobin [Verrucomicrobiota bacterium]
MRIEEMGFAEKSERKAMGEADVRFLVDQFYAKVREDELVGPIFTDKVEDWSMHLPTMYAFWGSILFGKKDYSGNPFAKHSPLDLEKAHFDRWLELFLGTVDELFEGAKAEHAKSAAKSIAHSFQARMGINPFGPGARFY